MKINTLVIGDGNSNSVGLVRSLGEAGYNPDVFVISDDGEKNYVKSSKYVNYLKVVPNNEKVIIDELNNYAQDKRSQIFVFPSGDNSVRIIDNARDILNRLFVLPSIEFGDNRIVSIMSKGRITEIAAACGLNVPKSKIFHIAHDSENDKELFGYFDGFYPLIAKPDSICEPGCDFKIINDNEDLTGFLKENVGKTVLFQQYIIKNSEITVQGVGFGRGLPAYIPTVIHKIRTSSSSMGTSTYAQLIKDDKNDPVTGVKRFVEEIGYSGIFDIDFVEVDSNYYFIEFNYRNGSNGYAFTKCGANLPNIWIKYFGQGVDPNEFQIKNNFKFMGEFGDFKHVLDRRISFFKWFWEFITAKAYLSWNFKDQKPFWSEVRQMLKNRRMKSR